MTNPACPITGEPAIRLVQWTKARFLASAWKHILGVPARSSFGDVERFGLWESPTGLYFFDPMTEGDHEFYTTFYSRIQIHWPADAIRNEFKLAARRISPGQRVLDVGCGHAGLRRVVPHAHYVGLDRHFATGSQIEGVLNQTLSDHLRSQKGTYDVVCALQVVEHLASPATLFADMTAAARPGGLVIVGVPYVPSGPTQIPNFLFNAPPHHLTWWTPKALATLAERNGAIVESIEIVPWGPYDSLLYWMARCSPIKCRDVYYRNAWRWHAAALISYLGGRLLYRLIGVPKNADGGSNLLLVARCPR
jgi:SAM-dependent methyltransferase